MKPGLRPVAAAAAAALALAAPAVAAPLHGKDFVVQAVKGDNAMIELGKLARKKAASARIREFGRLLQSDHEQARAAAADVAKALGASVPSGPTASGAEAYDRLSKLSGKAFDLAFVSDMVWDHKQDIAAFAGAIHDGNAKVAKLARRTLPKLEDHLKVAHRLQARTAPDTAAAMN